MTLRPATQADVAAMLEIYTPVVLETAISFELEPPSVAEFGARLEAVTARDPWLVAEIEGRVAGYAYASDFRSRPAYAATRETTVYVADWARGRSVGTRLVLAILDVLTADGVRQVIAGIALPNDGSIALHERLGYTSVGTFEAVGHKFGRWHDLGFWQRGLPPDPSSGS
ncbi:MAG: GNAT family N-acetyltransferase [Acidimicrobiales bacterium]